MKKFNQKMTDDLVSKRNELINQILSLSKIIRGTFFQRFSTCARPNCACHKGKRHGPRSYVAVTTEKKQRQYYVPNEQVESVRESIEQFHKMLNLMDEITKINIELMKGGVLNEH
jgi:hypothetical protein